jgi:hypothetical protein
MADMKKEFQKVIATIRKEKRAGSFPKPMMTTSQMEKRTATVNCGGEWGSQESTMEIAKMVMEDERFKSFLVKSEATAKIETNNFGTYQIRINY